MEALRKQASKLREQVARQQQAVLKQFGASYGGSDNVFNDETEFLQHQKLEKLYLSTRAAKHFQREIVRGLEGFIITGSKQVEIGNKLSEDSRKYSEESTCTVGNALSKAALCFGKACSLMETERGNMVKALGAQVAEPLRAMVMGAPLDNARHITQRYDKVRQEAEAQAIEVSKRRTKLKETPGNADIITKLKASESKLLELKSNMKVLGKEALAAMTAVEAQQQRLTLQRMITMIESERNYHRKMLEILDLLQSEIASEPQRVEFPQHSQTESPVLPPPSYEETGVTFDASKVSEHPESMRFFLAEAIHSYEAESEVELNLSVGDFVVVRKVSNNGWAEGECKGKSGWFPVDYIERRERVLASRVAQVF